MALKDIFNLIKADRYTADGCEEIKKAQEAIKEETADAGLPDGTMRHRKNGDFIKQGGQWVPAKNAKAGAGKADKPNPNGVVAQQKQKMEAEKHEAARRDAQAPSKKTEVNTPGLRKDVQEAIKRSTPEEIKAYIKELRTPGSRMSRYFDNPDLLANVYEDELKKATESKSPAGSTIKFEDAQKAIKNGQVVQWQDRDGKWNDVDPRTSELVMARDIGSKLRIKTDENGNPVKAKPEPGMDETRSKLLELEKRRKKFEKYPDMDDSIRLEQAALLSKAGFESRAAFEDFVKSEMPNDAAPRVLTGDCKIRVRKSK